MPSKIPAPCLGSTQEELYSSHLFFQNMRLRTPPESKLKHNQRLRVRIYRMQTEHNKDQLLRDEIEKQAPARKSLVRQARLFPKNTIIWIQGIVVWKHKDQIAVDDGTGIARIDVHNMKKRDSASDVENLQVGNYVMVVGEMAGKFKGRRLGVKATTLRDMTSHGAIMESFWFAEVVDGFLICAENAKPSDKKMDLS